MSGNNLYNPDQDALNTRWIQPWSEAFRAQRDVGLRIPINFHTVPATSLSRACFLNNQYEHNAFQKCFSNLLGVGFRRFSVDTYWDPLQLEWSLCPVEQPSSIQAGDGGIVPVRTGATIQISSAGTASAKVPESTGPQLGMSLGFARRQDTSRATTTLAASSLSSATSVAANSSTSPSARPTVTLFPSSHGPPLLQIGNYNCTTLMNLRLLAGIMADFLKATSTTTGAALIMLTFNIHATSSILDPNAPAPQLSQSQLPTSGSLLSDVLKGNLTDVAYTPPLLQQQRRNLNESWLNVDWNLLPVMGYYNTSKDLANDQTTTGWPTEAYMEFQKLYRLVVSYGRIDPQMQLYNIGPDLDFIFPPQTLTDRRNTSVDRSGRVSSGCLSDRLDKTVTSQTNSSWAVTVAPPLDVSASPDLMDPIPAITNLTACGLTPYLNQTLANVTADKDPLPYAAYVHSTLWSWAPGEPLNVTSEGNSTGNRCAAMMAYPHAGRWQVTNCATKRRVACHEPDQPYTWELSDEVSSYEDAASACRPPYRFSVPHTALENSHLLAALQSHRENGQEAVLVDLNSLAVSDCWVVGRNGTCPYLPNGYANQTRIVVVPTVAAVIIFVLAALTFFVKCAANRQENKRGRRRRMVDGWEYEGVPS